MIHTNHTSESVRQPDWLLIHAVRRENVAAFEVLTRRYYDVVYRLAMNAHIHNKQFALADVRQFFLLLWIEKASIPESYESKRVSFLSYILKSYAQIYLLRKLRSQDFSQFSATTSPTRY